MKRIALALAAVLFAGAAAAQEPPVCTGINLLDDLKSRDPAKLRGGDEGGRRRAQWRGDPVEDREGRRQALPSSRHRACHRSARHQGAAGNRRAHCLLQQGGARGEGTGRRPGNGHGRHAQCADDGDAGRQILVGRHPGRGRGCDPQQPQPAGGRGRHHLRLSALGGCHHAHPAALRTGARRRRHAVLRRSPCPLRQPQGRGGRGPRNPGRTVRRHVRHGHGPAGPLPRRDGAHVGSRRRSA